VVVGDVDVEVGRNVVGAIGASADFVELDVTKREDWDAAVARAASRFGSAPTVLVHAAGIMIVNPFEKTSEEDVRRAFEVNVLGTFHGMQAVVPGMKQAGSGSIVVLSSATGPVMGTAGLAAYAASKAGNAAIAKSAAIELGPLGIRVNAIVPGGVDTPMSRGNSAVDPNEFYRGMPIPRIGRPDDIAYAALYLASEESTWVTGTDFLIDGGMRAGPPAM
jgi:3alpha(or 20beta)-hydroxysteroid dehydrogenase